MLKRKQQLTALILGIFLFAGAILPVTAFADPPEPQGRRLRAIVEDKFADSSVIIGATTGSWAFGTNTGLIMDREFSYVTPENDFKQSAIHPDPGTWNWDRSDAWLQHIIDNNQILRMHCPISPQCSNWAKDDSRTPEELETNLREFFTAVCKRYNGKPGFKYMDVVNETVAQGVWHTDKPGTNWECPWYKIGQDNDKNMTPLYIKIAYEIAQQYAPDTKLIFNQHDSNPASWKLIKETIDYLRGNGLRVDGIGWQAHIDNGFASAENLDDLRNLIDWAHENDLEFHITEASVWLKDGASQEALEEQAATYRAILEVLLEKRSTGKVAWNIWHIDDTQGWHTEWYPSLFDMNYTAKPAYYAIQQALENAPCSISEYPNENLNNMKNIKLFNNHPNPFSQLTIINYELRTAGNVVLRIFDMLRQEVRTLMNENKPTGYHSVVWNGADNSGRQVSSGVYFYSLELDNRYSITKKMLLLK